MSSEDHADSLEDPFSPPLSYDNLELTEDFDRLLEMLGNFDRDKGLV